MQELDSEQVVVFPVQPAKDGKITQQYKAVIKVEEYRFSMIFDNPMNGKGGKENETMITFDNELDLIVSDSKEMIFDILRQCRTGKQFAYRMHQLLGSMIENRRKKKNLIDCDCGDYYNSICKHLDMVGWKCVESICSNMTQMVLKIDNCDKINHLLYIEIENTNLYSLNAPLVIANTLPLAFNFEWKEENNTNNLLNIVKCYKRECDKYKYFWSIIDDFYVNTVVLSAGLKPNYNGTNLKILIDIKTKTYAQINLNPLNCNQLLCLMQEKNESNQVNQYGIKFFGPKTQVSTLEKSWKKMQSHYCHGAMQIDKSQINYAMWDLDSTPLTNIKNILKFQLPTYAQVADSQHLPPNTTQLDIVKDILESLECQICQQFNCQDTGGTSTAESTIVCEQCYSNYHVLCLSQWFQSLKTQTVLSGECPNCKNHLCVS